MPRLKHLTPFVPVSDLDASVRFFETVLGFTCGYRMEGYAYLHRDAAALRLIPPGPQKDLQDPNSQLHCYVDVEGLDELYRSMEPALSQLPAGRVRPPFNTHYGQREFHVIDEDALLISFGEPIHDAH